MFLVRAAWREGVVRYRRRIPQQHHRCRRRAVADATNATDTSIKASSTSDTAQKVVVDGVATTDADLFGNNDVQLGRIGELEESGVAGTKVKETIQIVRHGNEHAHPLFTGGFAIPQ